MEGVGGLLLLVGEAPLLLLLSMSSLLSLLVEPLVTETRQTETPYP